MHDPIEPKLAKWPFYLGDALLLGTACFVCFQTSLATTVWHHAFIVGCVAGGATLATLPFLLEYRLVARMVEIRELAGVTAQIRNLETLATQISGATAQWQTVQESADKTAATAKSIAERMAAEVKGFSDFMQRANETEKATLRLEVEKSRRAEADWLQVLVRMLDHVFALYAGAVRSAQPNLVEQVGHFQNACCDAARRVGLTPFAAKESEPFDVQRHQLVEGDGKAAVGTPIAETVAAGYTFQGRLLRPALVRLQTQSQTPAAAQAKGAQNQLPLEAAKQNEG
jgi:molecular chaperone GrpE (heat shock protein)